MTNQCSPTVVLITLLFLAALSGFDSATFPPDIQVLRNLKDGLDPDSITPGSCLSSWDFSVDPCDTLFSDKFTCGLRCDSAVSDQFRVTEIALDSAGYSGSLSSSTNWSLPHLLTLDLSGNSFSGPLPHSLSSLIHLRRLCLSGNSFSGQIPSSIGSLSRLEELYLDSNLLSGPIPPRFSSLTSLKRLEIQGNNLSGEFPDLGPLQNLYYFDASNNKFAHEFDRSRFPTSLIELSMRNNSLRGDLPEEIGDLGRLQVLDLSHNQLSGPIVSGLFDHRSLQQLTLSYNDFTSLQVPGTMGFESKLIAVDLSHNGLRGLLPAFLCSMPELSALSLENNRFTGMIPRAYAVRAAVRGGETAAFERLLLGGNYLFGWIPTALLGMEPGSANVSLVDNCLYRCPRHLFFCHGGGQKTLVECKRFWPVINIP